MDRMKRFVLNLNARFQSVLGEAMYEMMTLICIISGEQCNYTIPIDKPDVMITEADHLFTQLVRCLRTKFNDTTNNVPLKTWIQWFKEVDRIETMIQERIDNQWYKGNKALTLVIPTSYKEYLKLRNELFVLIRN